MDAAHFPSTLTTRAPIASGSMAHDEEQAGWPSSFNRVVYPPEMDNNNDVEWTGFLNFFAVEYPDCFVLDESLPISDSPLPSYIELGPEWGTGETPALASSDPPEERHTLSIPRNTVVRDEYTSGTWNSPMDHPDLCLSPSTPPVQVNPSDLYPTPRSLSPPSRNSSGNNYTIPQQSKAVAGPSTWKLYQTAPNIAPTPLPQDAYNSVTFGTVATPSSWDSAPKKKRRPRSGHIVELNNKLSRPSRRAEPYTESHCPQPATPTNTQILKDAAGTHTYMPIKPVTVATRLAPLYDETIDSATTFFGLQRVSPPPDALHRCPHTGCSANLRIEDFPAHYEDEHSDWDDSACQKGHCPSFDKPHNTNGAHGASCRKQIVCHHRTHRMLLDREAVKEHVLGKHLKLSHIECPHCSSVLISMDTMAGHLQTCRQLGEARRTSKKDVVNLQGGNDSNEEGLGSSANGIGRLARGIAADLGLHHIKWIMPQAYNVGADGAEDEEGVNQSVKSLQQIIAQ
ncbi:hypothetical protein F5146DRAFT_1201921 [Armillaria mellea]|nr:hypothetical protein F5146DRAFT_1201921 [Armillaria mellea]